MKITDEMIDDAQRNMITAPDIIFGAEAALLARGVTDSGELVPALLTAAWTCHKDMHGEHSKAAFANLLRGWADRMDAMTTMN